MTIHELKKEIKGVFKPPVKKYYFGKILHGTPYFDPWHFHSSIVSVRKLKLRTDRDEYIKQYPHLKDSDKAKFSNLPMVRRRKEFIVKLGNYYLVQYGWPVSIQWVHLGWKWKYDSVRYEWPPMFQIYFFKWQFVVMWNAPDGDNDSYYEQILWWLKGCDKDIVKAISTWGWVDNDGKSTWKHIYN